MEGRFVKSTPTNKKTSIALKFSCIAKKRVRDLSAAEFIEIKNIAQDSLIENYGAYFTKEQLEKVSKRIKYLTEEEIEREYHGMKRIAPGFYCSEGVAQGDIVVRKNEYESVPYIISVTCHEILHGVSNYENFNGIADNDNDTVFQIRISGEHKKIRVRKNVGLNEGITEWLVSENMKSLTTHWFRISYSKQVKIVERLSKLCGKDGILSIYCTHSLSVLENLLGSERTEAFCQQMDELHVYMKKNMIEETERIEADLHAILDELEKSRKSTWFSQYVMRGKPGFTDEEQVQFVKEVLKKEQKSKFTESDSSDEYVRTIWNERGGREGR